MATEIEFKRVDLGDDVVFEGEIEDGNRFVFGKYSFQSITYIGEFNKESEMEGFGKLSIETNDVKIIYVGTFKGKGSNGLPLLNGHGTTYYFYSSTAPKELTELSGGVKYEEGKFVDNKLHGQGTLYYNDGSKYEGGFVHRKMHGKGIFTGTDGKTSIREYDNGRSI